MEIAGVSWREFKLSDSFINAYHGKQPNWGPLGYVTFLRTYSRYLDESGETKEEFWQTLQRVVEGTFNLQKYHCHTFNIPWNQSKAMARAERMYDKMWRFQFLPSGRGLWLMGTDFMRKHGSAGLNSCAFTTTENIHKFPVDPFTWAMEISMLGVGVGFDTRGAARLRVQEPSGIKDVVIEDSREGWVASLEVLLEAFFMGKALPKFDYSQIRPRGQLLKHFGGRSSGPDPLINMHQGLIEVLSPRIGEKLTSVDIVDIFTNIGKCVVSGNIRRSAMIALGDVEDEEFKNLKLDQAKMMSNRWASNNSVFGYHGMDYRDIVERCSVNGEPGIVWLDNVRGYGRLADGYTGIDNRAVGVNPCFAGGTLIAVADGRGAVPIRQLVEEGRDVPVYSVGETGKVEIQWARNPRMTREKAPLIEIVLDDDTVVRVTPDHKMRLLDGTRCYAKDLKPGDSLPRLTKRLEAISPGKRYLRLYCDTLDSTHEKLFEHRVIAKFFDPEGWSQCYDAGKESGWVSGGLVVHHKDYDHVNNAPDNLEIMTFETHRALHARLGEQQGEKNGMWGKQHSEQTREKIGERTRQRNMDPHYRRKMVQALMANTEARRIASDRLRGFRQVEYDKWRKGVEDEARACGLEVVEQNRSLYVRKNCEVCGKEFLTLWNHRGQSYCTLACMNQSKEVQVVRHEHQRVAFEDKQRNTLHQQVSIFLALRQELARDPLQKEWVEQCKVAGVAYRFRTAGTTKNPYAMVGYRHLKQIAGTYNHRVKEIRYVINEEPVYNLTVEHNHTVGVVTTFNPVTKECSGIFTFQCGEQTMEPDELCNLIETFPVNHSSLSEYKETLEDALLYGKSVTLLNTKWPRTNGVMSRNRRLGISQTGITEFFGKVGLPEARVWCEEGYQHLREEDFSVSQFLCIRESIKLTSVKPSGSISLLPGVSPGIHYPHSEYYIRRMRLASDSTLLPMLRDAGYPMEPDVKEPGMTTVVEFPIRSYPFVRGKESVPVWQQLENAAFYQHYWSDNNVSITVTFNEDEKEDLIQALPYYERRLKVVSMLMNRSGAYQQAPYEEISAEEYERRVQAVREIDYGRGGSDQAVGEMYCTNDTCSLHSEQ